MAKMVLVLLAAMLLARGALSTTFTFDNNCPFTVWPATLSGASSAPLPRTGFELASGTVLNLDAPPNWSGRLWARYECSTDASGKFACASADCGTGQIDCNGAGGAPPATLLEFTLNGAGGKDFYDVSLVDGFNLPASITAQGGSACSGTACPAGITMICPSELQQHDAAGAVVGCKSACEAFGGDQYCCTGSFHNPNLCKPTNYSQIFKNACPQAYSYPYDDASSTFTCVGANYQITFCP